MAATTPVMTYDTTNFEVRYNSSSLRYKQNVRDVILDSKAIYGLRPTLFDSNEDSTQTDMLGYIAEECENCSRDFAGYTYDDKGFEQAESIDWFKILMYAIEEIKQLQDRIEILEMNLNSS